MPKPQLDDEEAKDFEFSSRFCLVCNVDQPVRARHCHSCKKCVYRWDHHCTWLGNCIGEKNHLAYFFYLLAQAVELVSAVFFLIREIGEGVRFGFAVVLLILLFPLGIFCIFLGFFHCYLAGRNLTTVECVAWKKTFYLVGKSRSPFDQGCLKNFKIFCSFPRVRDWNRYLVNVK
jgi:palmitoyltransferase